MITIEKLEDIPTLDKFFDVHGFERRSHYKGDYGKTWYVHGDFVVGLFWGQDWPDMDVIYKEKAWVEIAVTEETFLAILSFLEALADPSLLPLHVSGFGEKLVAAYFEEH